MAAIKLTLNKKAIYIMGIYRPDRDFKEALACLSNVLETVPTWKTPMIIMGDINIDCLKPSSRKNEKQEQELQEHLTSYNLTRIMLPPTRITTTSKTSIDLVATNLEQEDLTVHVTQNYISDHTGQFCTVKHLTSKYDSTKAKRRLLNNQTIQALKCLLQKESWEEMYNIDCVEVAYNIFNKTLSYYLDVACPIVETHKKKQRFDKALQDPTVIEKKKAFIQAHSNHQLTGTLESKALSSLKKKEYDLCIKEMRKRANSNYIEEASNKSKASWKVINSERQSKQLNKKEFKLEINGETTKDPFRIAEQLNYYFVNIAHNLPQSNIKNKCNIDYAVQNVNNFSLWPTDLEEVISTIKSLKPKTSASFDEISSKLIKECGNELGTPITHLINLSFSQGVFPSQLKIAKVHPKLKNGDPTKQDNYRPISILPCISKIFEKVALTRLMDHLLINNLLPKEQHGFIPGRSTTTAAMNLIETLIQSMENGDTASAIFLDYSKAFDSLCHNTLIIKLNNMGIKGQAASWFNSYLTGRTQAVEITTDNNTITQKTTSNKMVLNRGVPQGSILGPVLFIIYVSDLPQFLANYCESLMYADDTVLLLQNQKPEALEIESFIAVNMAQEYCQMNNLYLNGKKSQQLFVGKKKDEVSEIPELTRTTEAKYLGIIIDEHLSWHPQVNQLCKKLSSSLYVLRRLKQICDPYIVKTAYFSLFESNIRYCLPIWGGTSSGNLQRVLILQKKAIRILANLGPQDSCRNSFKSLNILTVVCLYILETTLLAHDQKLVRGADIHGHNTRNAHNYTIPAHRLKIFERQPSYSGAKFWNKLPEEIKKNNTRRKLKQKITKWLLDYPFYTLEEFESGNYTEL